VAVEIGRGAGFLVKLLDQAGILGKVLGEHLNRAEPAVQPVACQVHARHAAAANPLHDVVFVADGGAKHLLCLFAAGHGFSGAPEREKNGRADRNHQQNAQHDD
jgi:hypothetical protein